MNDFLVFLKFFNKDKLGKESKKNQLFKSLVTIFLKLVN